MGWGYTFNDMCLEVRKQFTGVSSLLSPCGLQGLNSIGQTGLTAVPLARETSHLLLSFSDWRRNRSLEILYCGLGGGQFQ